MLVSGQALVGEVHDVDALVADRGAGVAADAFFLIDRDAKGAEAGINVHQCGQRAGKATPDAA